jgi:hypothetical protein
MGIQNAMSIDMNNLNFEQQKKLNEIANNYANNKDIQNYLQDIEKMKTEY